MIVTLKSENSFSSVGEEVRTLVNLPSHILHEKARQYDWQGTGILSLKSFWRGKALYNVGTGRYVIDSNYYLLLNHGQPYAITIDSKTEVESLCVFFDQDFAEEVYRNFSLKSEQLLDELTPSQPLPVIFFQKTYSHDEQLLPILRQIRASLT